MNSKIYDKTERNSALLHNRRAVRQLDREEEPEKANSKARQRNEKKESHSLSDDRWPYTLALFIIFTTKDD